MNQEKKHKHMTLEDRIENQECLNKGMPFKAIAQRIGKDQTTVSKEINRHGKTYTNSFTKTDGCCPRRLKATFVCNGCPKPNHSNCPYVRRVYQAKTAQREYETVLVESREGIRSYGFDFANIFPVLLTDNGGEFSDVAAFENVPDEAPEAFRYFNYERPVRKLNGKPPVLFRTELVA